MSTLRDKIFNQETGEIKELILSKQATSNEIVLDGRTALSLASAINSLPVIKVLVDCGADINLANDNELAYTPLIEAVRESKLEAVKLLVEHQADLEMGDSRRGTPLLHACIGAEKDILTYLITKGANINCEDINGQTLLHYLCLYAKEWGSWQVFDEKGGLIENNRFRQHSEIFNILLEQGVEVDRESSQGFTPLMMAAKANTYSFIKPLVDKGANVNFQNANGYSPLHAACDNGSYEATIKLITHGANINIVDNYGFTPILGATSVQNVILVNKLIELGADKNIACTSGYDIVATGDTALKLAERLKNRELVAILNK